MSTAATLDFDTTTSADEPLQYRAVHTGAIIGLVLGIVSVFMVVTAANSFEGCLLVAPIPLLGIVLSAWSLTKIRREPDRYAGAPIALLGLALSILFLVGGMGYGGYVYATEVPDGYARISFNGMKPDELQERSAVIVPPEIAALDGKKVFIKGYIRPDSIPVSRGIKEFLLVRDNNQCCFGDLSKIAYYDQMYVNLVGSRTIDYSQGVFRMGGVLKIEPQNLMPGSLRPVFSLQADYAN
jgi:hypothetical protein